MKNQTEKQQQQNSTKGVEHIPTAARTSARACASSPALGHEDGGQVTISPPVKISLDDLEPIKVLAYGIDSLVLAIDIEWHEQNIFPYLAELKEKAIADSQDCAGVVKMPEVGEWPFHIKPFGAKGYEWLIEGNGFTLRIGNWMTPKSRPSVIAEVRSKALWELSPKGTVLILKSLLEGCGARLILMKPSRVDLCVDVLVPSELWAAELLDMKVTRANLAAIYKHHQTLTGMTIGQGKISARLYDKPLEIKQKSNKVWMYDIWELEAVPEGTKIIRVEFQLRREILKQLNLETITDLFLYLENTWAYCTENWLKFCDRPGLQSHQRKTIPFWKIVQDGFAGSQEACPLVRVKSLAASKKQLSKQAMGLLTSIMAIQHEENDMRKDYRASLISALDSLFQSNKGEGSFEDEFAEKVIQKRIKHARIIGKAEERYILRKKQGLRSGKDVTRNLNGRGK